MENTDLSGEKADSEWDDEDDDEEKIELVSCADGRKDSDEESVK